MAQILFYLIEFNLKLTNQKFAKNRAPSENIKISTEFEPLVRHSIQHMLTDVKALPTLDNIMQLLYDATLNDDDDALQWSYCTTKLYRFMKSIGFVFINTPNHCKYTKEREDVI